MNKINSINGRNRGEIEGNRGGGRKHMTHISNINISIIDKGLLLKLTP